MSMVQIRFLAAAMAAAMAIPALGQFTVNGNCTLTSPAGQCLSGTANADSGSTAPTGAPFALTFYEDAGGNRQQTNGTPVNGSVTVPADVRLSSRGGRGGTSGGVGDPVNPTASADITVDARSTSSRGPGFSTASFEVEIEASADAAPTSIPGAFFNTAVNGDITFRIDVGSGMVDYSTIFETETGEFNDFTLNALDPATIDTVNNRLGTGDYSISMNESVGSGAPVARKQKKFTLSLRLPVPPCCQPWDNGGPDGRGGQTSQLGVDADWRPLANVAFDDMFLCDGSVYTINTLHGSMNTNAALPKFLVVILPDCNGLPDLRNPVAVAGLRGTRFDVDQDDVPFVLGDISFNDSGAPDADGYRPIEVTASFGVPSRVADTKRLILKGGVYWVTFIGYSADLNPLDEFFWATSGNQRIKGKPGLFFDGEEFRSAEELCCGCTDYNFCVQGDTCKILLDNGGPLALDSIGVPGSPSLQNGSNTQTRSRAADKFVLPPCTRFRPCYVEAWLWTNCDRAGLQFIRNGCSCPPNGPLPPQYIQSDCVMHTGITTTDGSGVPVELKKFQFYFNDPVMLEQMIGRLDASGFNIWISVFGLGDNRQNARAYFAYNDRCDRECDQSFGPGCIRPAPADQTLWRSNMSVPTATIIGHDYAFLIAVDDLRPAPPPPTTTALCPADIDRSGTLTVQDLFDFLAAWFAGCP